MLTKTQTIALNYLIIVLIALLLYSSVYFSDKQNYCNQEILELFSNRSNIEYNSLMDLSDRNVNFLDRNKWLILGEKAYSNQEESKGMEELGNVYDWHDKIMDLNKEIKNKKGKCGDFYFWSKTLGYLALVCILIQLILSLNIINRTKFK